MAASAGEEGRCWLRICSGQKPWQSVSDLGGGQALLHGGMSFLREVTPVKTGAGIQRVLPQTTGFWSRFAWPE